MIRLEAVYRPIKEDLNSVKKVLLESTASEKGLLRALAQDIFSSPGKLLRPALVLLSAAVGGQNKKKAVQLAAAIELLHIATLVQDDAIDKAELRRGKKSLQQKWGEGIATLFGDYLFSRSFGMLSSMTDFQLLHRFLKVTRLMATGEMEQLYRSGKRITVGNYFAIIKKKTACLFEACCESGAILGGATSRQASALKKFGLNFGMAFQIVDDCLDLTSRKLATREGVERYLIRAQKSFDGQIAEKFQKPFFDLCDYLVARVPSG
jgi:geranylgeranyl pyrophosphate synthase